jgi:hypothetical protein
MPRVAHSDPVLDALIEGRADLSLDAILELFPGTTGDAPFDDEAIGRALGELRTSPEVNTGHPLLDRSVKIGLVYIDLTFQGDHPKYGNRHYGIERHDGFPPTIIAAVDALSAWGLNRRAAQLFRYWLSTFVRQDGTFDYYGPSLSEYGQILHTAALLHERAGGTEWWDSGREALGRVAGRLAALCTDVERRDDLIAGIPEADIATAVPLAVQTESHSENNRYFHNNAWVARGLSRWAELVQRTGADVDSRRLRQLADALARRTVATIERVWPTDPTDWWLPPQIEPCARPESITSEAIGSYTNYRYWPELLSSGILPAVLANRVVDARLTGGGQFCGMSRFEAHLDDWPLADYLSGVLALGRTREFLLSLYGHVAYHQAAGHLTACEQVSLPPGSEVAPYCLPCQLVAARAARFCQDRRGATLRV